MLHCEICCCICTNVSCYVVGFFFAPCHFLSYYVVDFFGATTLQLHNRCMTCDCPKYSFEENETRMQQSAVHLAHRQDINKRKGTRCRKTQMTSTYQWWNSPVLSPSQVLDNHEHQTRTCGGRGCNSTCFIDKDKQSISQAHCFSEVFFQWTIKVNWKHVARCVCFCGTGIIAT